MRFSQGMRKTSMICVAACSLLRMALIQLLHYNNTLEWRQKNRRINTIVYCVLL